MRKMLIVGCLLAIACGKSSENKAEPAPAETASTQSVTQPAATAPAEKPAPSATAAENKTVELRVVAHAAQMVFEPTELTVPAGSTVHLVLEDEKPGALPHNWALVMPGTEAKVAAEGLKKGEEASYIAEGPDMIAYTKLAQPGSTGDVTFKAPAPGKYPYICTYPGHYVMMKGVLTVTP